jgi:hypothetical protein
MDTINDQEQQIYKRSKAQIKKLQEQKLVEESDAKLVEELFCINKSKVTGNKVTGKLADQLIYNIPHK